MSLSPSVEEHKTPTQASSAANEQDVATAAAAPESQIVQFYTGRCVLVTGASGFVGKLLVEKLLRTCPGVKKIFVLMRPKRGKSARERLAELFESPIFDTLKAARGDFEEFCKKKVVLLQGDLTQAALGLSIERLLQLADECSVILHSAAIVSFDGTIRRSLETNLCGTHNVLQLATRLPRLRALVHVSTCYSNCTRHHVGEHIYPVNIDPRALIEISQTITNDDPSMLEALGLKLRGEHPNYYTYTKQLAEYLCAQFVCDPQHSLPVIICRPSIIISTQEEPLGAFVDNRNAGNGIFDGVSRGVMRTAYGSPKTIMDQVPADKVVNCALALAWFCDLYHRVRARLEAPPEGGSINTQDALVRIEDKALEQKMLSYYATRKKSLKFSAIKLGLEQKMMQVPVFNVSSGTENPITFYEMANNVARHTLEYPSSQLFRQPAFSMYDCKPLARLSVFIQHTLVGKLMDLMCTQPARQHGKRRSSSCWSREFARINKFNGVLPYFYLNSFKFYADNRRKLLEIFMNDADRLAFSCDIRRIDWDTFSRHITLGIRRYLIAEPDSTLAEARTKFSVTLWRNKLLRLAAIVLICYFFLAISGF